MSMLLGAFSFIGVASASNQVVEYDYVCDNTKTFERNMYIFIMLLMCP